MKTSDYIYNKLGTIEVFHQSLTYQQDDIRRDFHGMVQNSVQAFYGGHISNELSRLIKSGQVAFSEDMIADKKHINCLVKIYGSNDNPVNALNSALIISCWGSFELSVTTLCESLLPQEWKDELSSLEFERLLKILKDENIKEATITKLKTAFSKDHLTHVPVWRKFNSLVKYAETLNKKYTRTRKVDVEFISRYGDMRNSLMHSNGIYHGENRTYTFKDYEIKFEKGKQFTYRPDKDLPKFYLDLVFNLTDIFKAIADLYQDTKFISYPDLDTP